METKTYGYIRVSSKEQNEDRQLEALKHYDVPARQIYLDKQSGKDFKRPAYQKLMKLLKPGDLIITKSIDRLGRNYEEIIDQWRIITKEKRVDIKVIDMPLLDTTYGKDLLGTFIADLTLQVLSFTAQLERENIRQRQAEGIAAAKAKGKTWGRKPYPRPSELNDYAQLWQQKEMSLEEIAERFGVSRSTAYHFMKEVL